jgi:chromosome segregation ATPase
VDTFVAVVPRRPVEDIKKDIERVKVLRTQAKLRMDRAQEDAQSLAKTIDAKKKDLEALEGHLDSLDSDKNADEIATGKRKTALLEKLRDLLDLRKDVREEETKAAAAAIAHAEAQEEFYGAEASLAAKRTERAGVAKKPVSGTDIAAMDLALNNLEGDVLERWEKALDKHDDSVSEEKDLLKLLKKLAEAQTTFHAP